MFDNIIEPQTAGLPQNVDVKWTDLSCTQIVAEFSRQGIPMSRYLVNQMLNMRGYKKRKLLKMDTLSQTDRHNEQFEKLNLCRDQFTNMNFPVLSIDTKKKEMLGNFCRPGTCYSQNMRRVNDHDFASCSDGQIVPHGIYDVNTNTGYVTLGTSKDTSEFVCENLYRVWNQHLQYKYPHAHTIMILCDGGGSNASAHYIVKQDLCRLVNRMGMKILMVHYPPYCSKYNPIEHKLFAHITRAWQGVPFYNIQLVKELTDRTSTSTGLKVYSVANNKQYQINRTVEEEFKKINNQIIFDDQLPKWNYLIKPA